MNSRYKPRYRVGKINGFGAYKVYHAAESMASNIGPHNSIELRSTDNKQIVTGRSALYVRCSRHTSNLRAHNDRKMRRSSRWPPQVPSHQNHQRSACSTQQQGLCDSTVPQQTCLTLPSDFKRRTTHPHRHAYRPVELGRFLY
jgi:hypothetical protein